MTPRRPWQIVAFSSVGLGLAASFYLLTRTFTLLADRDSGTVDICSSLFGLGCDALLKSSDSWFFGIPVAGWGVVYFCTLGFLLLLTVSLDEDFAVDGRLVAMAMGTIGALISLGLVAYILFGGVSRCPLCLLVHTLNLIAVVAIWRTHLLVSGNPLPAVGPRLRALFGPHADKTPRAAWHFTAFLAVVLAAFVMYQWVVIQSEHHVRGARRTLNPKEVIASYQAAPLQEILVSIDDPRRGSEDAPVQLVVFSSFACRGCREFSMISADLFRAFPHEMSVVFKNFPLGTRCDQPEEAAPGECRAAWAAEAARNQGRFWPFHDALYDSDLSADETVIQDAMGTAGLNSERFELDRTALETRQQISGDIDEGEKLGIHSVPAVFLNGRRVRPVSRRILEVLINRELSEGKR